VLLVLLVLGGCGGDIPMDDGGTITAIEPDSPDL
jgi:hypothetical protein